MFDVNPFDDLIVKEPRRLEPVVSGLNDAPLETLKRRFERLAKGAPPRSSVCADQALLVTSGQPGYGKSHLIGRLFRELHGRGTLVYVRPFQNGELAFQSLLAAIVKEMRFPDRADWSSWRPEEPTQLDALAHGVLGHLVADLAEKQGDGDPAEIARIRQDPVAAFGLGVRGDRWADWMRQTFAEHRVAFEAALARRGVTLHSPEWLRVLFAYGYSYPDRVVRQTCLDWISGQSLSAEQAELVGLRAAEILDPEVNLETTNQICRERLIDICQLNSFYRPFVFCFDQTEAYGHSASLARTFGMVIATLVNEAANQLTTITSNQDPWEGTIRPHFEDADAERVAMPPMTLEGLTRAQGEELIRLRISASELPAENFARLNENNWLDGIFTHDRIRLGTRQFLQRCRTRWEELEAKPEDRPTTPPPRPPRNSSLTDLYESRRLKLLAEPKRLLCDADTLRWLVTICADGLPELKIESVSSRYFNIVWRSSGGAVLFGFEAGSNWRRWEAIAREAQNRHQEMARFKAVLFRGVEQPVIPGASWKVGPSILEARATCLHLISLSRDDFAELYAGYDLYAEALGGDIPPYTESDVITFLHTRFERWWVLIGGPVEKKENELTEEKGEPEKSNRLREEVRRIVAAEKFLSLDEVIIRLNIEVSREEVLQACGYSAEIRVHAHPQMTVLQWQNT